MNSHQRGATAVEFALVSLIFFSVVLGILEFGRVLYTWNAVAEATRWGARQAVVCGQGSASVLARMQLIVPSLTTSNVSVQWYDGSGAVSTTCDASSCAGVSVSVSGVSLTTISPLQSSGFMTLNVPGFSTYLPREIMGQDAGSSSVCS
ncbi:pilus assembly protein TadE [Cupriavidus sp. USMAA2-4]|uniref:Pilus assembly protein TadE n=1 Tax=Cupriavidus malaysiensis TaxID=367825 RepID=A0ABN4TJ22_9BURK|nr:MULTISPECIES: TadE family protein [Cupriavidus]AOY91445.1 pilus assembly protein TadE [Cupriavidus sp. USMAA2-4]AOY98986.1 pilus assembly protein TadE [Cupriavidus sp. USMAHM13]AOZ05408.1 pilus assembly protein TadE [Cupriavidus malaysiensis]